MVEILLAGIVLGVSSASIAGLFISSGMQFFRTAATSGIIKKKFKSFSTFPTCKAGTSANWKEIEQSKIPANLLEITLLGPEMSYQFIATKIGIFTKACGEIVILPGYRDEFAITENAVIRIDLVNPKDVLDSRQNYDAAAGASSAGSAALSTKVVYIASSEGYNKTTSRPSSSSGKSGTEVEILTKQQWKIPHAGLEFIQVPKHRYEPYDYLGVSRDQVLHELSEMPFPDNAYARETAQHTLRKAVAIQLTSEAANDKSLNFEGNWTYTSESTAVPPNISQDAWAKVINSYTSQLTGTCSADGD